MAGTAFWLLWAIVTVLLGLVWLRDLQSAVRKVSAAAGGTNAPSLSRRRGLQAAVFGRLILYPLAVSSSLAFVLGEKLLLQRLLLSGALLLGVSAIIGGVCHAIADREHGPLGDD